MNCEDCAEMLTSLVFNELSEEQELEVHALIAECDDCREKYIEMLSTQNYLEQALADKEPIAGLSEDRKNKIMEAVKPESKTPVAFPAWIFAAAACLVIGGIVFMKSNKNFETDMAKSDKVAPAVELNDSNESETLFEEMEKVSEAKTEEFALDKFNEEAAAPGEIQIEKEKSKGMVVQNNRARSVTEMDKSILSTPPPTKETQKLEVEDLEEDEQMVAPEKKYLKRNDALEETKEDVKAVKSKLRGEASQQVIGASAVINAASLKKMLEAFSKLDRGPKSATDEVINKIKSLKNEQIEIQILPTDRTAKDQAQKILMRISENGQKAIDYAHIFVHNQKIIRVERVK